MPKPRACIQAALLMLLVLPLAGCGLGSTGLPIPTYYTASLSGSKEVPSNASGASGSATALHYSASHTMDITITVTGISVAQVTGFHVHLGASGVNGPVIVDLSGLGVTFQDIGGGMIRASASGVAFPQLNEADLLAGNCYVNVHTMAAPSGEIRGQLVL